MMKKILHFALTVLLAVSCSVNYDPGESSVIEKGRLVVNSILNPLNPLTVRFYTTFKADSGYWYRSVRDVKVIIKENGTTIYNGICNDTLLSLDYFPKTAASYSIEASLPGFDAISASTNVPDSITCFVLNNEGITSLLNFQPFGGEFSLWITAYLLFSNGFSFQYNDLHANNMLVDYINRWEGLYIVESIGGSGYHEAFLRIKNKNLPQLDSLRFYPSMLVTEGSNFPDYELEEIYSVKLITASKEYDQYNRTLYQQKSMIIYDDDISAIVYQPIQVYSNIKNGLGIFAGMSESNYYFPR